MSTVATPPQNDQPSALDLINALDGEEVQFGTTPDNRARMLCYLRHLLEANGDWRSDPWIKKAEKGRSGGFSDVDR